jgi:hypothetical protein
MVATMCQRFVPLGTLPKRRILTREKKNAPKARQKIEMPRRFPPPWTVGEIPGGFKVLDANRVALAYNYARDSERDAAILLKC